MLFDTVNTMTESYADDSDKGYIDGLKEREAVVLSHKPTKVLQLRTSNPVAARELDTRSLHQKLADG